MKPFDKINIVRKVRGITSSQKLILLTIATHLGDNDFVYLSLTTLQLECCLARDNVSSNLKERGQVLSSCINSYTSLTKLTQEIFQNSLSSKSALLLQ